MYWLATIHFIYTGQHWLITGCCSYDTATALVYAGKHNSTRHRCEADVGSINGLARNYKKI
jgi:hypothetical protein